MMFSFTKYLSDHASENDSDELMLSVTLDFDAKPHTDWVPVFFFGGGVGGGGECGYIDWYLSPVVFWRLLLVFLYRSSTTIYSFYYT